jgi:hypothetical protein
VAPPFFTLECIVKGMTRVEDRLCELAGRQQARGLVFDWDQGAQPRIDTPSVTLHIRGSSDCALTFTVEEIAAYATGAANTETEARIHAMAMILQKRVAAD